MPGEQGSGAAEGRMVPGWADPPERTSETALPDSPASQGGGITAELPPPSSLYNKCTSHLGFGLVQFKIIGDRQNYSDCCLLWGLPGQSGSAPIPLVVSRHFGD